MKSSKWKELTKKLSIDRPVANPKYREPFSHVERTLILFSIRDKDVVSLDVPAPVAGVQKLERKKQKQV